MGALNHSPALAAALAVLLAGCNGEGPGHEDPEISTSSSMTSSASFQCANGLVPPCIEAAANATTGHRIEFLDCTTYFLSVPVDWQKLQALLPPGYSVGTDPTVGLAAYLCESAVVDNNTVYNDVQRFILTSLVNVPEDVAEPGRANGYSFEQCINIKEIRDLMNSASFSICDGKIEADLVAPQIGLRFTIDGTVVYDFSAIGEGDVGGGPIVESTDRDHSATAEVRAWYDERRSEELSSYPGEGGPLQVTGGILAQVLLHPGSMTTGNGGIGAGTYSLQFPSKPVLVNP